MAQWVFPDRQHSHRFNGTFQDSQGQRKLPSFTAHLNCFDPICPEKQRQHHLKLVLFKVVSLVMICFYFWYKRNNRFTEGHQPCWQNWAIKQNKYPLYIFVWLKSTCMHTYNMLNFYILVFQPVLYLCEAQLGCINGAGTLFSSWMMVSLSVEMVRTLEPWIDPFHLNSPAGVMQNLCERCRLLSWSWV